MANNGINFGGEGSNIQAGKNINVKNTVTIKKGHFVIGLTVSVSLAITLLVILVNSFGGNGKSINIEGRWATDDGKYIEFLADGTMQTDVHSVDVNPDTYEILSDGSFKWGRYDGAWIQYFYTYWNLDVSGNNMSLTSKDNPNKLIKLTKQR